MSDFLRIHALKMMAQIGVHAWEQQIKQQLSLDIQIEVNCRQCNEQLSQTVDYAAICDLVIDYVENTSFLLIETVAEKVAELLKKTFAIQALTLTVSKPHAIKQADNISITITR